LQDLAFSNRPAGKAVGVQSLPSWGAEDVALWRHFAPRDGPEQVALRAPNGTTSALAQTYRASRDRVEDRLRIGPRLADRPEDLAGGGGLLLKCFVQRAPEAFVLVL
jgi:hypothetical protein